MLNLCNCLCFKCRGREIIRSQSSLMFRRADYDIINVSTGNGSVKCSSRKHLKRSGNNISITHSQICDYTAQTGVNEHPFPICAEQSIFSNYEESLCIDIVISTLRNEVLSKSRNCMLTLPRYWVLNTTGISTLYPFMSGIRNFSGNTGPVIVVHSCCQVTGDLLSLIHI